MKKKKEETFNEVRKGFVIAELHSLPLGSFSIRGASKNITTYAI